MKLRMRLVALLGFFTFNVVSALTVQVQRGDSLSGLASRYGTTVPSILQANPGLNAQKLQAGQRLKIPGASGGQSAVVRTAGIRVSAVLPVQGRVTTAPSSRHVGFDLAARSGTSIRAALGGSVVTSEFDARAGWGWTVVLDHGNGFTTRYSHNSANLVRVGQQVTTGQVIARVGSTGNSTGPHVDFRVYLGGVLVNPYSLYN